MFQTDAPSGVVIQGLAVQIGAIVIPIIAAIVVVLIRKYAAKLMARINASDAEKEAIQCLLEGMASANESIVREAKKAAADGKLTKQEIELAKTHAIGRALEVAKGPALDALKTMGSARMGSIIKQLLAKMSKKRDAK